MKDKRFFAEIIALSTVTFFYYSKQLKQDY